MTNEEIEAFISNIKLTNQAIIEAFRQMADIAFKAQGEVARLKEELDELKRKRKVL